MSSIPQKDRVSLCRYTFSDHRQCRTPRSPHHRHFCFYHARLESQSASAAKLASDIAYFFSGEYVCANDLSKVLASILPAIIRGDIKPRLAKTIVYLAQTFNQTIQLAQHEYINAYGTPAWRHIIDSNITDNTQFDAGESLDEPGVQAEDVSDVSPSDEKLPDAPEVTDSNAAEPKGYAETQPKSDQDAAASAASSESPTSQISHPERSDLQSQSRREAPASSSSAEAGKEPDSAASEKLAPCQRHEAA